jgi:hypothetical protein
MPFPESNVVLSFARGRARQVARALLDLDFQRDRDGLRPHRTFWFGRTKRRLLQQKIDQRVRELITLQKELDSDDPIHRAIEGVRTCHAVRNFGFGHRESAHHAEIAWGQALEQLERSLSTRAFGAGRRNLHAASEAGIWINRG